MTIKITKDEIKSPDHMTQTLREGFVWTTAHSHGVLGALATFIVIGGIYSIVSYVSEKKETAQQEKYFVLEKKYTTKKQAFDEAEAVANRPANDKEKAPATAQKATGDITKDYGSVIEGFESFINEAPQTKAAQMAALNTSEIYLNYKKNDDALSILGKVEKSLDKDQMLAALVWMQMGNALANKNDCKSALEKWQKITSRKALAFAHDEAKLRMGLCFETMNEIAKAEEIYAEIGKKGEQQAENFSAARDAQKYLRLMRAKQNL